MLLGCLLAVSALFSGCANLPTGSFDPPEIELVGLEPVRGAGMEARFRVALRIVNPNDSTLSIRGMAYDVSLRDHKLLSGVSDEPLELGPFSETTTKLEVAAGMLGSLALLRNLMTNPPAEGLPYALNAKLSTGGLLGTVRVNREGLIQIGRTGMSR